MINSQHIEHRADMLVAGTCCHCLICGSTFAGHLKDCGDVGTDVVRVMLADSDFDRWRQR